MELIYLDHNATTAIRPEVAEVVAQAYQQYYANPASQHQPGQAARRVLDDARQRIATIFGADLSGAHPEWLLFTSGGTEANNLAVLGICQASGRSAGHLIISAVEHASVIEPAESLMEQGWQLDCLGVTAEGVVRTGQLPDLITDETRLVSVILGNHETGVLQPVAELAQICNESGVPLHTDAVQVAGKLPIDFRDLGAAAMSIAAHKFGGPLGIGALLVRRDVPLAPRLFGGTQQAGLRPGTECVALVLGMLKALDLWCEQRQQQLEQTMALRDRLEARLKAGFPGLMVNGSAAPRLPQTSNVAFPGLDGQVLLLALDTAGIACSVGSACLSGSSELSPTLMAMGLPHDVVASSLRFSLAATTTEAEIDEAARRILHVCGQLAP